MPCVLLVEDEIAIAQTVLYALRAAGFEAVHCLTAGEALRLARDASFDLAVLDVGLPDMGGFALCRELRRDRDLPVIFLTAHKAEADRILGLEIGADDYVSKPFSPRELVARVQAVLRRGRMQPGADTADSGTGGIGAGGSKPGTSEPHRFEHDADGKRIRYRGRLLDLTRYEYGLLAALLQRPGAVLSRAQLMDRVWDDALDSGDRTVDSHIKTLRAKLREVAIGVCAGVHADADSHANHDAGPIRTHRGLGYSLDTG